MKQIYVVFDDGEFIALLKKKGDLTWREYILGLKNGEKDAGNNST